MKKIAIIGSGPAGLTAAYNLQKNGFQVDIYESQNEVGGMCKSIKIFDGIVDCGPHRFFSSDKKVNSFWLDIIEDDYEMINRTTRIFYKNNFFNYPIKPINALFNLGLYEGLKCVLSYIKEKIFPNKNYFESFETWTVSRFGTRLYEIFFKSYSEKLWGISCQELSADFASQRIKKLSLFEAVKNAFFKSKKHATLIDEFAFPKFGTGFFYQKLSNKFQSLGGKIFFNEKISKIYQKNDKIILNQKNEIIYDKLISTMPLTTLAKLITSDKKIVDLADSLTFRNTILVYSYFKEENLFPDQWLYINSEEVKTGRITNFKNWNKSIQPPKGSILCFEYWFNDNDELWINDNIGKLSELVNKDLEKISILKNAKPQKFKHLKIPKCYPVYKNGYKNILNSLQEFIDGQKNIIPIGRYGSFKYNNQDHSILMGLIASDNIINNKKQTLWEINTDYDYQEKTYITSTGLRKK